MAGGLFFGNTNLNAPVEPKQAFSLTYPDPRYARYKMDRNGTLDSFTTVTLRALKFFQEKILQRAPATWVPLVAGYPMQKINEASIIKTRSNLNNFDDFYFLQPFADLVTYTLKYQAPAGFKKAFGAEKMRPPLWRETIRVDDQPGVYYDVYSHIMDNMIQFDCWSSTGRQADTLAAWFKYFMEFMKGPIMKQGFQKISFWERGIDKDVTSWRDDIAVRSLTYLVKTEEMYIVPTSLITQINADIQVTTSFNQQEADFVKQYRGIPILSGCIEPSSVPSLSGLNYPVTADIVDNSCAC